MDSAGGVAHSVVEKQFNSSAVILTYTTLEKAERKFYSTVGLPHSKNKKLSPPEQGRCKLEKPQNSLANYFQKLRLVGAQQSPVANYLSTWHLQKPSPLVLHPQPTFAGYVTKNLESQLVLQDQENRSRG